MESQMSRKNFIIFLTLFYVFLYIVLKLFIVFTQDLFMNHEVYDKTYNIGNVEKITTTSSENPFVVSFDKNSIKFKNVFQNFALEEQENNYQSYAFYGDDGLVKAVFMVGEYETQLHNIHSYNEDSYYYEFNHFPLYISDLLKKHYLKKYNIEDDIDLIKFIRERKKIKCNFFTPVTKIKENYFFNFVELALPNLDQITYLEGDLNGYMFEGDNYKRVFLLKNDKLYCLTFHKLDYFTDDLIYEILSSIEFNS